MHPGNVIQLCRTDYVKLIPQTKEAGRSRKSDPHAPPNHFDTLC